MNVNDVCRLDLKTHTLVDVDFNPTSRVIGGAGSPLDDPSQASIYTAYSLESGNLRLLGTKNAAKPIASVLKLRFLAKGSTEFICGKLLTILSQSSHEISSIHY